MDGQRNLERPWKVREKSGNLKIKGCGKQTSENLSILFKRFQKIYLFCSLGEQILSFKSNPQI